MSGDASTSLLQPGSRLGSCELLCVLARGATSIVWLARNTGLGGFEKLVAVKTILPEHAADARYQKRLIDEARIAAELQDVHVVQVLDLGLHGDIGYIVMEHIDGESLRALLSALVKRKKLMPIPIALRIAVDICAGLAAAHDLVRSDGRPNGIIHRDVSPENVLLTTAGKACLIDFGFAVDDDGEAKTGTVGKPGFLAPEVAEGGTADARSDIWSAGAILYNMLSGRAPYEGKRPLAALNALLSGEAMAPLPDAVPEPVRGIVTQALHLDREQRFTRAVAMRKALETAGASTCGIAPTSDLAAFVERILAERIKGRRKAMERALQEAERREKVLESLMAPPEILPAGEVMTPWRQSEARLRAAEADSVPSVRGDELVASEPETLMKQPRKPTLRPDPSDFAMSMAPDTLRERLKPESSPKVPEANAPNVPPIPKASTPPSSSKLRAADLLASTAPPSSSKAETVPLAAPLVLPVASEPVSALVSSPAAAVSPATEGPSNASAPPPLDALSSPPPKFESTLPLAYASAPPYAAAPPNAASPPFMTSAPPVPFDSSSQKLPPVAESSSALPPAPAAPVETAHEPSHGEPTSKLHVLLALPGVIALVVVAVIVFVRTREPAERGMSTDSSSAPKATATTPISAPATTASDAPASPSASSSAQEVASATPSSAPSGSSSAVAGAASGRGRKSGPRSRTPRANASGVTTGGTAPPPPPAPAPEEQ